MEPPDSLQQVVGEVWLDTQGPADSTALGSHGQRRPGEAGLQRRRGCDLQVSVGSLRRLPAQPGEPVSARDCVSPTEPQLAPPWAWDHRVPSAPSPGQTHQCSDSLEDIEIKFPPQLGSYAQAVKELSRELHFCFFVLHFLTMQVPSDIFS